MKKNAVVEFIRDNPLDWRKKLSSEPYHITIKNKEGENLYIFNYNMVKSDFTNPVVCQSRGLILRVTDLPDYPELGVLPETRVDVCCWPFDKFFNIGETQAAVVDWATAKIQEKIDGSIIKLWYDDVDLMWRVSTNGVIDANECDLQLSSVNAKSFGQLFMSVAKTKLAEASVRDLLNKNLTYIFELTSPFNRVVVPYENTEASLIGIRDNRTGEERDPAADKLVTQGYFRTPKLYSFNSQDEMLKTCETLPHTEEGYVVVDANYNRVKVKGLAYLRLHRLKDANGRFSNKRVFEIVKAGEEAEILAYFPEHKESFDNISRGWRAANANIAAAMAAAIGWKDRGLTKKEFAGKVLQEAKWLHPFMFAAWDGKDIERYRDKIDVELVMSLM